MAGATGFQKAACASRAVLGELFLKIMARIGTVERLVAERKIRDDVVLDGRFKQWPLKPRGVAQMAAHDVVAFQAHPDQHVAPERFGDCETLAAAGRIEVDA